MQEKKPQNELASTRRRQDLTRLRLAGMRGVLSSTLATMLAAVAAGMLGLRAIHSQSLQNHAHEIAGATIAACGIAILCGL